MEETTHSFRRASELIDKSLRDIKREVTWILVKFQLVEITNYFNV